MPLVPKLPPPISGPMYKGLVGALRILAGDGTIARLRQHTDNLRRQGRDFRVGIQSGRQERAARRLDRVKPRKEREARERHGSLPEELDRIASGKSRPDKTRSRLGL